MSDPFGDDAIDFDLEAMLSGAYKNAVALLRDTRASDGNAIGDLINPITCVQRPNLTPRLGASTQPRSDLRADGVGAQGAQL